MSSGIEPVYSYFYDRTIIDFEGPRIERVEDYGYRVFGTRGRTARECSAKDHLRVLMASYEYVDSAVSKTCNVSPDMPWESFKEIYFRAWQGGCKGCTTFNPKGKRMGILSVADEQEACYVDLETGRKECE